MQDEKAFQMFTLWVSYHPRGATDAGPGSRDEDGHGVSFVRRGEFIQRGEGT